VAEQLSAVEFSFSGRIPGLERVVDLSDVLDQFIGTTERRQRRMRLETPEARSVTFESSGTDLEIETNG
jgi:hypothetical protein